MVEIPLPSNFEVPKRKVYLFRGIPGAGKGFTIKKLQKTKNLSIYSADFFFEENGVYKFDHTKLRDAHSFCFKSYLADCYDLLRTGDIVVDNTNIRAWEIAPYIQVANAYGLDHEIITVWCNPIVAAKRNVHGVPADKVLSMYQALLKEELPPMWKYKIVYVEENI